MRNIYRAKSLEKDKWEIGELVYRTEIDRYFIYTYNQKTDYTSQIEVDRSTIEVVKLDLNDTQKEFLLYEAGKILKRVSYGIYEIGKKDISFEVREKFAKEYLDKIKEARELLKGVI